jgi:hypothetical protein
MVLLLLAQQYRKRYGYARSTRTTTRSSRQVPDARECGAQPLAARKLDEDLWLAPWQQCSQRIWYLVVFTPDRRQRSGGGFLDQSGRRAKRDQARTAGRPRGPLPTHRAASSRILHALSAPVIFFDTSSTTRRKRRLMILN